MKSAALILAILAGVVFASTGPLHAFPGETRLVAKLPADELGDYYGLQYLLSDSQKMEYLSLSTISERTEWLDRFWVVLDPTPSTELNEARMEHVQRVAAARQLFGRADPPGWDERGEIFIRFGPPSLRMDVTGGVIPAEQRIPKELWRYDALNMSVTFADYDSTGEFTYHCRQKRLLAPGSPIWLYAWGIPFESLEMDYDADRRFRGEISTMRSCRLWEMEYIKGRYADRNFLLYMDTYAAVYSSDVEWAPLECFYDVVSFRGGDAIDRTEVSFEVPEETRAGARQGAARGGQIELGVLVRDDGFSEVAFGEDSVEIAAPAGARKGPALVPGQIVLALEPGHYHVGIEARESDSNRRAAFETDVAIPAYTASPCISEIQFASNIRETETARRFQKGTLEVVPHPLHTYRIPTPIFFYFEIYGLDTDKEGKAFYRVEYRIIPLEKKRWGPVLQETPANVGSAIATSAYGSTQPQRLSIATNELWEGPFRLEVTVTDRRTFKTAGQSAKFSLIK